MTRSDTVLLAPQYYGSVYYYATMWRYRRAVVDTSLRYDKRFKSVHRCFIADTHGELSLTVPLSRTPGCSIRQWQQMLVSSHGGWWRDHQVSLESAYGRTPYFEFYIDRFKPWLSDINVPVTEFDSGIDRALREALKIDTEVIYVDASECVDVADDCRRNVFEGVTEVPYYQVRADRLGFLPGLSVLDLLFNMGPEAVLVLDKMAK